MPKLILILEEKGEETSFEFEQAQITIGRTANNPIQINDAQSSRQHCRVVRLKDGRHAVEDLKSRNGTVLNGEPLTQAKPLCEGDRIQIGEAIIHYLTRCDEPPAPRPSKGSARSSGKRVASPVKTSDDPKLKAADGTVTPLSSLPFVIGSKPTCNLVSAADGVGPEHCMIVEDQGVLHVVDLGAEGGTKINGEALQGRKPLLRGATLTLGTLELSVEPKPMRASGSARTKSSSARSKKASGATKKASGKVKKASGKVKKASARAAKQEVTPKPAPKPVPAAEVEELDDLETLEEDEGATVPEVGVPPGSSDMDDVDFGARLEAAAAEDGGGSSALGALAILGSVLLVAGWLGVLARSVLDRPEGDPKPEANMVSNWSFEDGAVGPDIVGWVVRSDAGGAELIQGEQVGFGQRALSLQVVPESRPEVATAEPIRIEPGAVYRVQARTARDPNVAALLRVDWSYSEGGDYVSSSVVAVSDPASGEVGWLEGEVSGVVRAPRQAVLARVVVAGLCPDASGAGRLRVDRVHMEPDPEAPGLDVVEGPEGLELSFDGHGVLSLRRGVQQLAEDVGLVLDRSDSLTRQGAARLDQPLSQQGEGALLAVGAIAVPREGSRRDYDLVVRLGAEGVNLRWTVAPAEGASDPAIGFTLPRTKVLAPLQLDGHTVELPPPVEGWRAEGVREMAWGEGADQVSFRWGAPVNVELFPDGDEGATLWFLPEWEATADQRMSAELAVRGASLSTLAEVEGLFAEAEAAEAARDYATALADYRQIERRFAHQEGAVARAKAAREALLARAERLAQVVAWASREAQLAPAPELGRAARSAYDELERQYGDVSARGKAQRALQEAEGVVREASQRAVAQRAEDLLYKAQRQREAGNLALARRMYRFIVERFDEDLDAVREARGRLAAMPAEDSQ